MPETQNKLLDIYKKLKAHFGFQHWWPGESPFEIMIGAILTQNTSWSNVEKAIENLKKQNLLVPHAIKKASEKEIAGHIRSSGYFNQKAKKLKDFLYFYDEAFSMDPDNMKKRRIHSLRALLLQVKGIGKETADSILLYAVSKKVFVIDAYTKRIFVRLGYFPSEKIDYEDARCFFEDHLPRSLLLYKDYHAQLVMLGKHNCKKTRPLCGNCPLEKICDNICP